MKNDTIVVGIHAVQGLVNRHPGKIERVLFLQQRQDQRIKQLLGAVRAKRIACETVDKGYFENALRGADAPSSHQGVLAFIKHDRVSNEGDLDTLLENAGENALFLVLDGVTDPHNFGACLRSANAAGATAVIVPKDKSAPLNPAARKVASGAADITPVIRVTNLARTLKHMQAYGVWIVGAAGEAASPLYEAAFSGKLALVMGAEEKGLRRLTRETCDQLVKIPMLGEVSSLNVSVATGVCLFEVVRQTRKPSH